MQYLSHLDSKYKQESLIKQAAPNASPMSNRLDQTLTRLQPITPAGGLTPKPGTPPQTSGSPLAHNPNQTPGIMQPMPVMSNGMGGRKPSVVAQVAAEQGNQPQAVVSSMFTPKSAHFLSLLNYAG